MDDYLDYKMHNVYESKTDHDIPRTCIGGLRIGMDSDELATKKLQKAIPDIVKNKLATYNLMVK